MCVYVCVWGGACVSVYVCVVCVRVYVCVCVCAHACVLCVCMCVHVCVLCVCMCVHVCVCVVRVHVHVRACVRFLSQVVCRWASNLRLHHRAKEFVWEPPPPPYAARGRVIADAASIIQRAVRRHQARRHVRTRGTCLTDTNTTSTVLILLTRSSS